MDKVTLVCPKCGLPITGTDEVTRAALKAHIEAFHSILEY